MRKFGAGHEESRKRIEFPSFEVDLQNVDVIMSCKTEK
jgi:hypothetical protein